MGSYIVRAVSEICEHPVQAAVTLENSLSCPLGMSVKRMKEGLISCSCYKNDEQLSYSNMC